MSSINPKELYLRIVTQRGTRTLCHDIVVCCGEEELTDELCERKRLEIVACMQEELEPGEKIVSAEYVSKDSLTPAVRDNDKVVQWRTMDFIAYALSYAFDDDGAMAQIAYHSCPSAQDIKGSWISILLFALLIAFSSFRYFTLDLSLWIIRTVLVAMGVSTAPAVVISILFIAVNGVKYLQHTLAAGRY